MGDRVGDDDSSQQPRQATLDLLLREHQEAYQMFRHSEDLGERRVQFFMTLTTAVIGALAIRTEGVFTGGEVDPLFYYFSVALLLFGLVTMRRLWERNLRSSQQLRAIHRIVLYFDNQDPGVCLGDHLEFFDPADARRLTRQKSWRQLLTAGRGGLEQTVALINCVLVAFVCGLFTVDRDGSELVALIVGLGAGAVAWAVQFAVGKAHYDRAARETSPTSAPGARRAKK